MAALFGPDAPKAVQTVKAMLHNAQSDVSTALQAGSKTALGACVKHCPLLCVCRIAALALALENQ